jgi:ABC-type polysaccharide/polyol phosphate transport system ATPase subunit
MAMISLENVGVRIPVFGPDSWSLKKTVLKVGAGGRVGVGQSGALEVQALQSVSLNLRPGDRLALYGPNGSGKSTLLRVLAGIYDPTTGSMRREGKAMAILDLNLGMDPTSTGYENIKLMMTLMGQDMARLDEIVADVEDFTDLGDYLRLPIKTYSSGMTMRLAFAVATAFEADILLLDEWIAVGDAQFMQKAQARLARVVENTKILVLASHNREILSQWCNRFLLLDKGRVMSYTEALPEAA